jgi:hypothetical protein
MRPGLSAAAKPSVSVFIQFNPTLAKPEAAVSEPGSGEVGRCTLTL